MRVDDVLKGHGIGVGKKEDWFFNRDILNIPINSRYDRKLGDTDINYKFYYNLIRFKGLYYTCIYYRVNSTDYYSLVSLDDEFNIVQEIRKTTSPSSHNGFALSHKHSQIYEYVTDSRPYGFYVIDIDENGVMTERQKIELGNNNNTGPMVVDDENDRIYSVSQYYTDTLHCHDLTTWEKLWTLGVGKTTSLFLIDSNLVVVGRDGMHVYDITNNEATKIHSDTSITSLGSGIAGINKPPIAYDENYVYITANSDYVIKKLSRIDYTTISESPSFVDKCTIKTPSNFYIISEQLFGGLLPISTSNEILLINPDDFSIVSRSFFTLVDTDANWMISNANLPMYIDINGKFIIYKFYNALFKSILKY